MSKNTRSETQQNAAQHHGPTTMPVDSTSSWWEAERANFIRQRIADLSAPGQVVVDVGCGRATMLDTELLSDRIRINVDMEPWPEWSKADGLFVCAKATQLPFRDNSIDVVGSFDMIEHVEDDETAMREQARVARKDGHVVTAVPADQRLWSAHDEAVGHYRRYSFQTLAAVGRQAHLRATTMTSLFSYLWLPAYLLRNRSVRRNAGNTGGDLPRPLRALIGLASAAERQVARRVRIPFGSSLWAEFVPGDEPTDLD